MIHQWAPLWWRLGCTSVLQVIQLAFCGQGEPHNGIAASRRYSQWLCAVRYCLAHPQGCEQLSTPFCEPRCDPRHWNAHQHRPHHQRRKRISLDKKYSSQVSVPCYHGATSANLFTVFLSVIIGFLGGPLSFSPVSRGYCCSYSRC